MAVGGLAIANDAVTGTNANGNSGGIRTAETYTSDDSELAIRLLTEQLPWLSWMPRAEQVECLSEILTHLAAGAETGTFEPFARAVAEWEHTAEVWADPELAKRLSSDIRGDGRAIPRPKAQPSSGA